MNKDKIKELLALLDDSDIEELEFENSFWRTRIRLSRRSTNLAPVQQVVAAPLPAAPASSLPSTAVAAETPDGAALESAEPSGHIVKAPMVGTMYHASSPEAEPFIKIGDRVKKGQTLCLIEAMKIMNEIEADIDGQVVKILVNNAAPVEYNQPLIELAPI